MSQPFIPRPWQEPMMEHIVNNPRCAIFALPGAGKTGGTLMPLRGIRLLDQGPGLILVPKGVLNERTWEKEAAKWDELDITIVTIAGDASARTRRVKRKADFYVINYEQLPWLVAYHGDNWPYRTIICDESTKLKGHRLRQGGQRTKALAKVAWRPDVERVILLTGTPSPNGIKDLWGQLWFLDKGERLGRTHDAFKSRWFRPTWDGYGIEPFPHSQKEIQERISDLCLTVNPGDYVPIDKPVEIPVEIELPPKARQLYDDMERAMFIELAHDLGTHEIEALSAAGRVNKCLQLANGFVYHNEEGEFAEVHEAKLDALEHIIAELGGLPVLVGYQFKADLEMMRRRFPKLVTLKEISVDDFNTGRYPILAGHPASMGHGIDGLQHGTHVMIDYSSGWNLEFDQQILERIGPMRQMQAGYKRPVYRYRLIATDTADEMVQERRESKATVQEILLAAMNRRLIQ